MQCLLIVVKDEVVFIWKALFAYLSINMNCDCGIKISSLKLAKSNSHGRALTSQHQHISNQIFS